LDYSTKVPLWAHRSSFWDTRRSGYRGKDVSKGRVYSQEQKRLNIDVAKSLLSGAGRPGGRTREGGLTKKSVQRGRGRGNHWEKRTPVIDRMAAREGLDPTSCNGKSDETVPTDKCQPAN